MGLTPQAVAELSSTGFGYSKTVAAALSQQTADTGVGTLILLLAFLLQLANSLWPMSWKDFGTSWRGVVLAIVVSATILTLAYFYSGRVQTRTYNAAMEVLNHDQGKHKGR